jgi:hypothetical protein
MFSNSAAKRHFLKYHAVDLSCGDAEILFSAKYLIILEVSRKFLTVLESSGMF